MKSQTNSNDLFKAVKTSNFHTRFMRVLRLILINSVLISSLSLYAQKDSNILLWKKDYRLHFKDFQGKPSAEDTAIRYASDNLMSHKLGAILTSIQVDYITERGKTVFTIHAGMKKNESWLKDNKDSISLSHEQGHFDICEIYTRQLRRDIQNATTLAEARMIFDQATENEAKEQIQYDKENNYNVGGISPSWFLRINARLKELEKFSSPIVTLAIGK